MIRTIIETNVLLYVMTAAGALGILCQFILGRRYSRLTREVTQPQPEKKNFMKKLRYNYRTDRKRCNENTNIPLFVRRQINDYRFLHMSLHQWKRMAAGLFLVSIAGAAAGLLYCFRGGLADTCAQNILWTAGGITAATAAAALWTELPYKTSCLQMRLEDYLYHAGNALDYPEPEAEQPAGAVQERVRRKVPALGLHKRAAAQTETNAQREKRELKTSLAKIKDGMRESAADAERERNREILRQMDSREQERIIRDVLAEYLA